MKIKNTFTIEDASVKLREELSSHIAVIIRSNIIDNNKKWLDVDKDAFIGVRITFYSDKPKIVTYVPNFFARMIFGGVIGAIFHYNLRQDFKEKIEKFIITNFYEL